MTQWKSCQKWTADFHFCRCQCIPGAHYRNCDKWYSENLIGGVNVWHTVISLAEQCFTVGRNAAEIWGMFQTGTRVLLFFCQDSVTRCLAHTATLTSLSGATPRPAREQVMVTTHTVMHGEARRRKSWSDATVSVRQADGDGASADRTLYKTQTFHASILTHMTEGLWHWDALN